MSGHITRRIARRASRGRDVARSRFGDPDDEVEVTNEAAADADRLRDVDESDCDLLPRNGHDRRLDAAVAAVTRVLPGRGKRFWHTSR